MLDSSGNSYCDIKFRCNYFTCLTYLPIIRCKSWIYSYWIRSKSIKGNIRNCIRAINMFNRLPIVQIHNRDIQCGTHHIRGNWDENITSILYDIRHLSKPLSRANVYIEYGRKNAPRMKPSTYPNSAKAGHHGDITFYEQKHFFQ